MIRELSLIHPLTDFNGRTFSVLLLNYLLMQNSLMPVIMDDCVDFDLMSTESILPTLISGQHNFLRLYNTGIVHESDLNN